MSRAVRPSIHTAPDSTASATLAAVRANAGKGSFEAEAGPVPIVIPSAEVSRAFDLFQPEPGDLTSPDEASPFRSESGPAPVVPIDDERFSRQVARRPDDAPSNTTSLNLPLGGVAPTAREVDAARALIVGWIAACGIAAFAFLSQGPTVTARPEDSAPPPVVDAPRSAQPGDIHLDPAAAPTPAAPRAKKSPREQAPSTAPAKP